jgi:hypothetical protein
MDNPTTLLVAIMYVTIVATGLMAVLMALSEIVARNQTKDPVHSAWIVILLMMYFSFFWETTVILELDGWNFLSFLGFIFGPVVLLFATNLIIAPATSQEVKSSQTHYLAQSGRFFTLMSIVQFWIVGLDILVGSISELTYITTATGLLFLTLALSKSYRLHVGGTTIMGLAILIQILIQAF